MTKLFAVARWLTVVCVCKLIIDAMTMPFRPSIPSGALPPLLRLLINIKQQQEQQQMGRNSPQASRPPAFYPVFVPPVSSDLPTEEELFDFMQDQKKRKKLRQKDEIAILDAMEHDLKEEDTKPESMQKLLDIKSDSYDPTAVASEGLPKDHDKYDNYHRISDRLQIGNSFLKLYNKSESTTPKGTEETVENTKNLIILRPTNGPVDDSSSNSNVNAPKTLPPFISTPNYAVYPIDYSHAMKMDIRSPYYPASIARPNDDDVGPNQEPLPKIPYKGSLPYDEMMSRYFGHHSQVQEKIHHKNQYFPSSPERTGDETSDSESGLETISGIMIGSIVTVCFLTGNTFTQFLPKCSDLSILTIGSSPACHRNILISHALRQKED